MMPNVVAPRIYRDLIDLFFAVFYSNCGIPQGDTHRGYGTNNTCFLLFCVIQEYHNSYCSKKSISSHHEAQLVVWCIQCGLSF